MVYSAAPVFFAQTVPNLPLFLQIQTLSGAVMCSCEVINANIIGNTNLDGNFKTRDLPAAHNLSIFYIENDTAIWHYQWINEKISNFH